MVQHSSGAPFFLSSFQERDCRLGHDPGQGVGFILSFFDPELLEGKERKTENGGEEKKESGKREEIILQGFGRMV